MRPVTLPTRAASARRIVTALAALLFLNAALGFREWWPTPGILPDTRLAPEFVWLWVLLGALVAWRDRLSARALDVLGVLCVVLVLARYADVTTPSLFGRALNLYWDVPQIPRFLLVSLQERAWWQLAAALAVLVLLPWLLFRMLRPAIAVLAHDAIPYALRTRWAWAATALAVALTLANHAGVRATWPWVARPVTPTYWKQFTLLMTAWSPERLAAALPRSVVDGALASTDPEALAALQHRDVYVLSLESVGAVVYDDARARRRLAPARERLAADIAAAGMHVVSAFMRSPTIGGGSDLAHLSLLSGVDLSDPRRHDLLLTTGRPTLIDVFRSHGYQTFGFYPSVSWEWPERAYYRYDVYVEGRDLDYRGPPLGNWKIPDQFAFARFEQLFPRDGATPPRFVFAGTINTHLPFNPVPPYQPDWQRLLGEHPFDEAEVARSRAARTDWLDMLPAYIATVEYTYRWLGGYFALPQPRETLYVLLGDHQPTANVSGAGASWDVPVHLVARDTRLLERFAARGFAPGLEPPRASLGGLHDLTGLLLEALARQPGRS